MKLSVIPEQIALLSGFFRVSLFKTIFVRRLESTHTLIMYGDSEFVKVEIESGRGLRVLKPTMFAVVETRDRCFYSKIFCPPPPQLYCLKRDSSNRRLILEELKKNHLRNKKEGSARARA